MNEFINESNIKEWNKFSIDGCYTCVLCLKRVYADSSYSNKGHNLICLDCFKKNFKSRKSYFNWSVRV